MGIIAGQAAREIGVSVRTLALWADQGKIRVKRMAGGWRLYHEDDVQKLKRKMQQRVAKRP